MEVYEVAQKLKIELSHNLAVPFPSIYLKEMKSVCREICIPVFIAALFIVAKHGHDLCSSVIQI